jgi:predicted Ser/Thr protein kinase
MASSEQVKARHDAHVRALHEAQRADHEAWVARVKVWVEEAAAAGDARGERQYSDYLARLQAMDKPWEKGNKPAA